MNLSRRGFLSTVGGAIALAGVDLTRDEANGIAEAASGKKAAAAGEIHRRNQAYKLRKKAALTQKNLPMPDLVLNGDEKNLPPQVWAFSKTLPHNALGEVEAAAYASLVSAIRSDDPASFEQVTLGGTAKLINPQAGICFGLEGADSHHLGMAAPPSFSSEQEAAEMAEVYWQALTRDIAFSQYGNDPLTNQAISDLSQFDLFSSVNTGNLFRGRTPGDLAGPYISQFLWKNVPYGAMTIVQQYRVTIPGDDHLSNYQAWLNLQNGLPPATANTFDATPRYIRNGRDLAEYLRLDFSYQPYLNAALILLGFGPAALNDGNPYKTLQKQASFSTFGGPHVLDLVARVANEALMAAWFQKWFLHLRMRPEEFAGRVHNHMIGAAQYPIHPKLLNSQAVSEVVNRYGTYLVPVAYAAGCPAHPSYPSGHAAIAGACITILKALFNESFVIPSPAVASDDGLALLPYGGEPLTIGGELNKLASNMAIGRNTAGIHWRTDASEGIRLGEQVAVGVLRDHRGGFSEQFAGFSFTGVDGNTITI